MNLPKPYFLEAAYLWIIENKRTPFMLLDMSIEELDVPGELIRDSSSVGTLCLGGAQSVVFTKDFVQVTWLKKQASLHAYLPITAILAIFENESGEGIAFDRDEIIDVATFSAGLGGHQNCQRASLSLVN